MMEAIYPHFVLPGHAMNLRPPDDAEQNDEEREMARFQ